MSSFSPHDKGGDTDQKYLGENHGKETIWKRIANNENKNSGKHGRDPGKLAALAKQMFVSFAEQGQKPVLASHAEQGPLGECQTFRFFSTLRVRQNAR